MLAGFLARQIHRLAVTAWSMAVLGVGIALERALSFDAAWSTDHGDTSTDAASAVALIAAADLLIKALLPMRLAALAVTQPVLMLQHLNADTRNGWANRVFSTHELHRGHHSTVPAEANSNFGSALVLWDMVFGTHRRAGGRPAHSAYWRPLGALFSPTCCRA